MIKIINFTVHFNGVHLKYDRTYHLDSVRSLERLRMRLKRLFQGAIVYFNYVEKDL